MKGKGKRKKPGQPYASRARQDQAAEEAYRRMARARWEADVRRSRTTALRGRQRAPKHVRKAAAQAALEGHQEGADEEQGAPTDGGSAASSSNRPAHLPWPPPTPPVLKRDRASNQHEDARDPPVVLRENPDAPPTPNDEAYGGSR